MENVYINEKDFFKINGNKIPSSPFVIVQFKTRPRTAENNEVEWTTVSARINNHPSMSGFYETLNNKNNLVNNPDNFLTSLNLKDNGGLINCDLNLIDPYFSRLETIITKTFATIKLERNAWEKNRNIDQNTMVDFTMGAPNNVNFRIKFGYSDSINQTHEDKIINPENEFDDRTLKDHAEKMTTQTPWLYFQILDLNTDISNAGFVVNVKAMSISNTIFEKMKLLQKYNVLKGTPENILRSLGRNMFLNSKGKIIIVDHEGKPIVPRKLQDNGEYRDSSIEEINNITGFAFENMDEFYEKYKTKESFHSEYGVTWPLADEDEFIQKELEELEDSDEEIKRYAEKRIKEFREHLYQVKLPMGSEPKNRRDARGRPLPLNKENIEPEFMSLSRIMNEFCSAVPPIFHVDLSKDDNFKDDNRKFYIPTNTKIPGGYCQEIKKIVEGDDKDIVEIKIEGDDELIGVKKSALKTIPYAYSFIEEKIDDGTSIIKIRFFYRRVHLKNQEVIRQYNYRNYKDNIVNSLTINSKLDFINLNAPITFIEPQGVIQAAVKAAETGDPKDIEEAEKLITEQNLIRNEDCNLNTPIIRNQFVWGVGEQICFTGNVIDRSANDEEEGEEKARQFCLLTKSQEQLYHNGFFDGTLEIPGDPFYLFDERMNPYQYFIKIRVLRDFNPYLDELGSFNEESYLSGIYLIKNIEHNISTSFSTKLEIVKYPVT